MEMKQANIWFLVGLLQTIYGLIMVIAGIRQLTHPPATVLANLHATLGAGVAILLMGLFLLPPITPEGDAARVIVRSTRRMVKSHICDQAFVVQLRLTIYNGGRSVNCHRT
jgi:hypothetical protein